VLRVVVASANPGKVAEIAAILGDRVELVPRPADVGEIVEDGGTLEANARLKAAAIATATGLPALADDTGLEVDALGGAPGVEAAHYAGPHATYADNVSKLLRELAGSKDRAARFRTVALLRWPDGREVIAHGVIEGRIAPAPTGDGGFGYDPVFLPLEAGGKSFAQMSAGEKNAISHRGRAFRALAAELRSSGVCDEGD